MMELSPETPFTNRLALEEKKSIKNRMRVALIYSIFLSPSAHKCILT
jgi:hypothetical protein